MQKVRRILTLQDWIKSLQYILHNFFSTDLVMHKQGVVYEKESYQKKTRKRYKRLFYQLKNIIERTDKEELIKILQEKEDHYLEQCRKEKRPNYSLERITFVQFWVTENMMCSEIKAMLAGDPYARKNLQEVLEIFLYLNEKNNEKLRKEYRDYGYIPRREKVVKYLKR